MVQVSTNSNSSYPSYEEIKYAVYSWGQYFIGGDVWDDVKTKLPLVRDFAIEHPGYSKIVFGATTIFTFIGGGYGYTDNYFFGGAVVGGVLGCVCSVLGCTAHYYWENIKYYADLSWEHIKEHYIMSLASFGLFIGEIQGIQRGDSYGEKLFYGTTKGTLNAVACTAVGTIFEVVSIIWNNPEKPFEIMGAKLSAIKQGVVLSYKFIVEHSVELMIGGSIVLGGTAGAAFSIYALKVGIGAKILVTTIGAIAGGGVAMMSSSYKQVVEKAGSDFYKFTIEDHPIESMKAIGTAVGVGLAIEHNTAFIAVMAALSMWNGLTALFKPYEDQISAEIKTRLSGDTCSTSDENECHEVDQ